MRERSPYKRVGPRRSPPSRTRRGPARTTRAAQPPPVDRPDGSSQRAHDGDGLRATCSVNPFVELCEERVCCSVDRHIDEVLRFVLRLVVEHAPQHFASRSHERELAETPVEALDLSVRVFNSLKRTGITTVGDVLDLLEKGETAVMSIRNFGEKSLDELRQKMREKGYMKDETSSAE